MDWEFKGVRFTVETEELGPFVLASARAPRVSAYVRVKPFSALGRDREQAIQLLKEHIAFEFRKVPEARQPQEDGA